MHKKARTDASVRGRQVNANRSQLRGLKVKVELGVAFPHHELRARHDGLSNLVGGLSWFRRFFAGRHCGFSGNPSIASNGISSRTGGAFFRTNRIVSFAVILTFRFVSQVGKVSANHKAGNLWQRLPWSADRQTLRSQWGCRIRRRNGIGRQNLRLRCLARRFQHELRLLFRRMRAERRLGRG